MNVMGAPLIGKPRVAHVTTVHATHDVRIYQKECRSLFDAGYDVVMVAVGESSNDLYGPKIIGLRKPGSRFCRMTRTACSALAAAFRTNAVLIHLHDPELIPIGLVLKALGRRVIYDNHEYVVRDLMDKTYLWPVFRYLACGIASAILKLADCIFDGVVVAAPGMLREFQNRNCTLINNYPEWKVKNSSQKPAGLGPVMVYAGGISENRGIKEIVNALEIAANSVEVRLLLAGEFYTPHLEEEIRRLPGWRFVDYRGHVSRTEVRRLLSEALCGLVILHDIPNHREASPNKLFEYMAMGLPTIVSDFSSFRELLGDTESCLFVDPRDAKGLAERMCWIAAHREQAQQMGRRGYEAVKARFGWSSEGRKLMELYGRLVGEPVIGPDSGNSLVETTCAESPD